MRFGPESIERVDIPASCRNDCRPQILSDLLMAATKHQVHVIGRSSIAADEQVTVFRIPSLALPTKEELATEWGRRQLLPEQIMGQGVVYLIAAAARELTMTSDVFGLGILEEAYHIVRSSPQGRTLVLGWVRDSRKHNASVWLLSQSMHDTDEELRSLLRNRFVFRQGQGLGTEALKWLGLPASREFINLVERELVPGECLYQDLGGRVGLVRVEQPTDLAQTAAFSTTPVQVA